MKPDFFIKRQIVRNPKSAEKYGISDQEVRQIAEQHKRIKAKLNKREFMMFELLNLYESIIRFEHRYTRYQIHRWLERAIKIRKKIEKD